MTNEETGIIRRHTLFYSDAVAYLRTLYPESGYTYRDDFADLCFYSSNTFYVAELKSDKELEKVSTKRDGKAFAVLRELIHELECSKPKGKGYIAGWLCMLAQCYDYGENHLPEPLKARTFTSKYDVFVIPEDKRAELKKALFEVKKKYPAIGLRKKKLHKEKESNIAVLIYEHTTLKSFFENIKTQADTDKEDARAEQRT